MFLVAGHGMSREHTPSMHILISLLAETTAHALSFMIAFMAIYPDVQHKVLEEVSSLTNGDLSSPLVSILVSTTWEPR